MSKDLYTVQIPNILTSMIGKQNIREQIESGVKTLFEKWAHPELVDKIKVTKPRVKEDFGEAA